MIKEHSEYSQFERAQAMRHWLAHKQKGPVLATAVHAGHQIRDELKPYLHADEHTRRRDEDPLTGTWAAMCENFFINYRSRFEVDLNRSRHKALGTKPEDTWGQKIWVETPPDEMIERSLQQHDLFYSLMRQWLEEMIRENGKVLILDIHSYNHRRGGENADPAPQSSNPDIDLGVTTLDKQQFGNLTEAFTQGLSNTPCEGRKLDVRHNVRYPDGGHWPEWVYANYGQDICTITLEYKKFYVNEWTGQCSLSAVEGIRTGFNEALTLAKKVLKQCR